MHRIIYVKLLDYGKKLEWLVRYLWNISIKLRWLSLNNIKNSQKGNILKYLW